MFANWPSLILSVSFLLTSFSAQAGLGNPNAPQKGTYYYNLEGEPTTLNPLTSTDLYSQVVHSYVMDSLMSRNADTYAWEPSLAEKAETSKDGQSFTFAIRKGAKFHDGKPISAEDVKFSFDVIFDPVYNLAHVRPYYENIEKAEIIDPLTVRFTTKNKYFKNFDVVAGLIVIPKHLYGNAKEGVKKNKTLIGSGPYRLDKYEQGKRIVLARNADWWGNQVAAFKGEYNFQQVVMRFAKEDNVAIEMIKKGELDKIDLTPEAYTKKATGPEFGTKIIKKKVEHKGPKPYGFIGWNLKKELFKDRTVRLALAHLMNRDLMNEKFRFGMSLPATGPWYQQSDYANPKVKAIPFDPKKASSLLEKAGWTDSDGDGVLDKAVGGQKTPFRFTMMYANKDTEKYWTLYQEDLKKAGIQMELKLLEWNAFVKFLDEGNFDALTLAWGGGSVDLDPKQIWHCSSAVKGGSNFIGYCNPKVDHLIEKAREELDKKKRVAILQEVYQLIAEDAPYAFLFNDRYTLYAHTKRIKMMKPTYGYDIGDQYWWIEE